MMRAVDVDDPVELANQLRAIVLRVGRHLRSEVHSSGVTGGQIAILVALEFHPGMIAQQLAEREGLSGPGVSGHLARLEGKGLIRRERSHDGHRVGVFLTSAGKDLVDTVRMRRTSWLTLRLVSLGDEDRALIKAALPALDRVSTGDR
jgi:DNA-binding MarR family transcriptional regulator